MNRIGLPYGIRTFEKLVEENRYYLNRIIYLKKMERLDNSYPFFLRPRHFGKSLAISAMQHYYGKQYKDKFEALFAKYYIGQCPAPNANQYWVLKFYFSGILTQDISKIEQSFTFRGREQISRSLADYPDLFTSQGLKLLQEQMPANQLLDKVLTLFRYKCSEEKIFLLIDEYDHFTNEIIAFAFNDFKTIASRNGIVRKFFEVAKDGTQSGMTDRIFITGVSPITLGSLTSGFNITTGITTSPEMHDFTGFTEAKVGDILREAGIPKAKVSHEEKRPPAGSRRRGRPPAVAAVPPTPRHTVPWRLQRALVGGSQV